MLSCILHCQFTCLFDLAVGCTKTGFKIDPILLNWNHLIPGFYCILEPTLPVYDGLGYICRLYLGVKGYSQFLVF